MTDDEIRMRCLELAIEAGATHINAIAVAQSLEAYVWGALPDERDQPQRNSLKGQQAFAVA
jgi:hypothetical protein